MRGLELIMPNVGWLQGNTMEGRHFCREYMEHSTNTKQDLQKIWC